MKLVTVFTIGGTLTCLNHISLLVEVENTGLIFEYSFYLMNIFFHLTIKKPMVPVVVRDCRIGGFLWAPTTVNIGFYGELTKNITKQICTTSLLLKC